LYARHPAGRARAREQESGRLAMKTTRVLGVITACATMLAACASEGTGGQRSRNVVQVSSDGAGGCNIAPVPEIHVNGKSEINWILSDPSKYRFARNGIEFNNKAKPIPVGEFHPSAVNAQGVWVALDNFNTKGKFSYAINVVVSETQKTCQLDPIIYND
jgi:hypothetical protein